MRLEVLHVPDCPNLAPMLERLAEVTDLPITTRLIDSDDDVARLGMAGSPTLLIDGVDPFTTAGQGGVSCRLYRDAGGQIVPAPSVEQLRAALATTGQDQPSTPGEVLSAWRTRALPLDPVEQAVHQAILRIFAATGRPPTAADPAPVLAGSGRTAPEVLHALHEVDAIRLTSDGQIAVAYPFSATPTRHRVRIGDHVVVYAMCAIDALGMAPMLGHDTLIESVDVTTGRPVTVTTRGGHSSWEPADAVVFIGADSGGGPSADCCCDYLNFFIDRDTARAWTDAHPGVPGQIIDKTDAEDLAAGLFGHLLANGSSPETDHVRGWY